MGRRGEDCGGSTAAFTDERFSSGAEQPAAGPVSLPTRDTPRLNAIFGSATAVELQKLLEKTVKEIGFDELKPIVATTHGCYEAASTLPRLKIWKHSWRSWRTSEHATLAVAQNCTARITLQRRGAAQLA